ncbi:MAG: hypothetical protein ACLPQY_06145 [Streptosporangiaceae bacterium]
MGHRVRQGSRTPDGWQSQRSGRPRSYSPAAALEPGAANGAGAPGGIAGEDPDDDEAAYGGEWAAAPSVGGPAARGPARGFPPVPGQPDPSYPGHDFDAWNDDPEAGDQPTAATSGQWDTPASTTAHWDAAPVADWEATGTLDPAGAGDWSGADDWGEPGRTGEWAGSQTGEWARADEDSHPGAGAGHLSQSEHWDQDERWGPGDGREPRPWGEGSGHWDAPYGQFDENGDWHGPAEGVSREGYVLNGHDYPANGHDYPANGDDGDARYAGGYERADFAIAGRDEIGSWRSGGPGGGPQPGPQPGPAGGAKSGPDQSRRGEPGRAAARKAAARGSRNRTVILAAAAVVAVAALAATAYVLLGRHARNAATAAPVTSAPKLPTPTASVTSGAAKLGKWGYITSRATDTAPLTVAELYPAQFLINGSSFVRTTDRADTSCDQGLFGTQLQNAAKAYGCTQVVRASYISSDQTMMGTIGVANLSTANDAAKAGSASGSNDFVTPLNGTAGPTKNLSQGTGVVQAEYKGHYLILIWAEFANLKAPSTQTQRNQLEQFASDLISGSANIALSNRMVNGKPEATGSPG